MSESDSLIVDPQRIRSSFSEAIDRGVRLSNDTVR